MLWRCLRTVPRGVYVDVGAQHPFRDSVTYAFYKRGWSGINVEPVETFWRLLNEHRPRDRNVHAACGQASPARPFHVFGATGLSTLDEAVSRDVCAAGFSVEHTVVETIPLERLFAEQALEVCHFLKIDVEGSEAEVIESCRFERVRPWIVLVEAVTPITHAPSWDRWEPRLLAAGYRFVWFDGLNRFYVAAELAERLAPCFATPIGVLDGVRKALTHPGEPGVERMAEALARALRDPARGEGGDDMAEAMAMVASLLAKLGDASASLAVLRAVSAAGLEPRDRFGHPLILKEEVRLLLREGLFAEAAQRAAVAPGGEAHWSAILFARAYHEQARPHEAAEVCTRILGDPRLAANHGEARRILSVCMADDMPGRL